MGWHICMISRPVTLFWKQINKFLCWTVLYMSRTNKQWSFHYQFEIFGLTRPGINQTLKGTYLSNAWSKTSQSQQQAKMWLLSPDMLSYSQQHNASWLVPFDSGAITQVIFPCTQVWRRKSFILHFVFSYIVIPRIFNNRRHKAKSDRFKWPNVPLQVINWSIYSKLMK